MLAAVQRQNVRIVTKDPEHCVAVWHAVVFEVWRGPATLSGSRQMITTCEELLARGERASFFAILEPTSPPPSEQVRGILARWSRQTVPKMQSAIVVAEGGGFRAAIVRAVCTALTALVPHRVPFKFVSTVDEGLRLLIEQNPSQNWNAERLHAVVSEVRHQLG